MKITIPLNSTLSTDSHPNDIKDPTRDRDLFNNNRSYLYNKHLTNPNKTEIEAGGYITTRGDVINFENKGALILIKNRNRNIAQVSAKGIENTIYLDVDDAVIHDGSLWTVIKTNTGYVVEQTNLQTQEKTIYEQTKKTIQDVRFIRNTHKVIARASDVILIDLLDGDEPIYYNDDNALEGNMLSYLNSFNGEFAAVEINGKIWFGYNNPVGVKKTIIDPSRIITINITTSQNNWKLSEQPELLEIDWLKGYNIIVNVDTGVNIGGFPAMDFTDGIINPQLHNVELNLDSYSIISGGGGAGGIGTVEIMPNGQAYINISGGGAGGTAIVTAIDMQIKGYGLIRAGGGGGAGNISEGRGYGGGGGAGMPSGQGGFGSYQIGNNGNATIGGAAVGNAGRGGNLAQSGASVPGGAYAGFYGADGGTPGSAVATTGNPLVIIDNTVIVTGIRP